MQISHIHFPNIQGARSIASFAIDGPETEILNSDFPSLVGDRFFIDERK